MDKLHRLRNLNKQFNKKYVDFTNTQKLGKFIGVLRQGINIVNKINQEERITGNLKGSSDLEDNNLVDNLYQTVSEATNKKDLKIEEREPKIEVEKVRVVSKKSIDPGNILIFNYIDEFGQVSIRKVLTVNSSRTLGGTWFVSTKENDLLTAYDLNEVSIELLVDILKKLLNNKQACTYQSSPTELLSIVPNLKSNEFRTYNIDNITAAHVLKIRETKK